MTKKTKRNPDTNTFNKELLSALKKNDMNFSQCLMAEGKDKLSVVAKYDLDFSASKGYSFLNEELETELSDTAINDFYYGISPKISAAFLINTISTLAISTKEGLVSLIKENRECFSMHREQKDYLYYFIESAIITLTCIFGIEIAFKNSEMVNEIVDEMKMDKFFLDKKGEKTLQIRGCPSEQLLVFFKNKGLKFSVCGGKVIQTDEKDGKSIEEIYGDKRNIQVIDGSVFYSGVFLRALKIEKKNTANAGIGVLSICFEPTTYATVYAIENAYKTQNHPFISENKAHKPIVDFLFEDDTFAYEMLASCQEAENLNNDVVISIINSFLNKSHCVHQVVVSGNLATKDDILIIGRRDKKAIDAGQYYPGINGNAEISDANVEFYADSAYEDYPDLKLDDIRKDFFGELNREAYAELGVTLSRQNWKCDCLAIVGKANGAPNEGVHDYPYKERRIQFNVFCEQKCDLDFLQIVEKQKTATESYENKGIAGIRYKCYKGFGDVIKSTFFSALRLMLDMKSMVTSLLSLILFLILIKQNAYVGTIEKYVSIAFSVMVCLSSSISAVKWAYSVIKKERAIKRLYALKNISDKRKTDDLLKKMFLTASKDGTSFHPATFIAIKLYLEKTSLQT